MGLLLKSELLYLDWTFTLSSSNLCSKTGVRVGLSKI